MRAGGLGERLQLAGGSRVSEDYIALLTHTAIQLKKGHHRGIGRAIELPYRALVNTLLIDINIFVINICRF